ncbi:DUF2169 domain-containing protein [Sorangium sp. So ce385]|uniref:DUF2169 family type VI secretion system accessory protein n=1 Tax=Sorangium sp. So ce385 TaxID=3133308 RepID=UPI003F5B043B
MQSPWPLPIVALTPASCGALLWRMQGAERLTVIVKATFALVHDRHAELAAPAPLIRSDQLREGRGSLEEACETAPYLPGAGVLVRGHAAAPAGTTATALSVRVALFRDDRWVLNKELHVYGEFTRHAPSPRPFSLVPLVYERAYGGPHLDANPVGVPPGAALPSIFDPVDPTRPAGFGPIAGHWAPRRALLSRGEAPDPLAPDLDASFDFRYFHAAPADQQIERLRGDEWIFLQGLHPHAPWLRSRLPSARALARLHRTGPAGDDPGQPVELVADTLTIDADRLLCSLIWRGNVALLPGDQPARMRVVAGVEMPGRPLAWPSAAAADPASSRPWPPAAGPACPAPALAGDGRGAERRPAPDGEGRPAAGARGPATGVDLRLAPVAIMDPGGALAPRGAELPAGHWSAVTQQVTRLHAPLPPLPFSQRQEPHWSAVTQQVAPLQPPPPLPFAPAPEPHWSAVTQQVAPLQPPPPLPFAPAPEPPPRPEPAPGSVPFAMPFAASGAHAAPPALPPPVQPPLDGLDETHPVIDPPPAQAQPAPPPGGGAGAVAELPPSQTQPPPDEAGAVARPPPSQTQPPPDEAGAVAGPPPSQTQPPPDEAGAVAGPPPSQTQPPPDEAGAVAGPPPSQAPPWPAPVHETGPAAGETRSPDAAAPAAEMPAPASATAPVDAAPADVAPPDAPADASPSAPAPSDASPAEPPSPEPPSPEPPSPEPPSPEPEARGLRAAVLARLKSGQPLYDLELAGAELEGIDWSGASLERVNLAGATLARCNFTSARLARANLSGADLTDARLTAADLTRADLSRATLDRAQLSSASLRSADLTSTRGAHARFDGASLDGADLRQARLTDAIFDGASLADVNASKADLSRSSFANASLAGAILRAAKLKEASLPRANVDGADLREADLAGANLYGVKLANTKSSGAILRSIVEIPPEGDDINVSSQG